MAPGHSFLLHLYMESRACTRGNSQSVDNSHRSTLQGGTRPAACSMTRVAIIGAGLAGLLTARILHRAGVDCRVFEGRSRIGGRMFTVTATGELSHNDGFDLGPSWFWPQMQPGMLELVRELGLSSFPQASDGDVLFERMSREGAQRFQGYPQEPQSFRFTGGAMALARALAADIPPQSIYLNAKVSGATLSDRAVTLSITRPGEFAPEPDVHAEFVVAACPPRLLQHSVGFEPRLDEVTAQRWRDTPTWMAPHAKFVAVYDTPFWRHAGLSGTAQSMVGPMPEIHDATTASGHAALFGFIGVSAEQRALLGESALRDACVAQLVRLFGEHAAAPHATLLKDWAADELTATELDQVPGGHPVPSATPWVTGPWAHRLVMAGSETSPSEPGYLAGAVTAAQLAAATVLQRLRADDDAAGRS